ncbi:response regulator transcription factor [Ideonella sp. 4Y11]|uniref:Response regulator transcription factor n=2 Tax=Ideonella aquatica TaxID=2824119 RepID=A0A940YDN8_9BURK|nr:response regulator transcription factor [Ideonella aquatica]
MRRARPAARAYTAGMEPISVLIVEDDERFRVAFATSVAEAADMRLAGTAGDLAPGLRLLREQRPDVLLVDLGLPSGSGVELIRYANDHLPQTDVMVVSVFGDEPHVMASLEAGATGYLLKDAQAADLTEQIRTLRAGGSPISPVIARQLLLRLTPQSAPVVDEALLSPQERQVLTLSAKGFSFEEIARMLEVSRHTVMTYVKRSYRKLQVHSKTEAIYEARKLGLVRD